MWHNQNTQFHQIKYNQCILYNYILLSCFPVSWSGTKHKTVSSESKGMGAKTEISVGKYLDAVDLEENQTKIKVKSIILLAQRASLPKSQWGLPS